MEKSYRSITWFFVVVFVLVFIGFFRSYFVLFPRFSGISLSLHWHAIFMLLWLALLIVQPILIKKKKFAIHRYLGILSYFTTPVLIVLMVLMYKNQYLRLESTGIPREENLALLFLPFTDILPFTLFYLLAIYYRKNIAKHMRFMIATAIVVLSAGLFRVILLLFKPDGFIGLQLTGVTLICFFLAFIVYDKVKGKAVRNNPYRSDNFVHHT